MAPAGTPPEIVYLLSRKLAEVASSAQYQQQLSKLGSEQTLELTDQFSRSLEAERTLWKSIAKEANVRIAE